ncbi:DUF2946 family protein [Bradyrhizobium sp. HKCCYLS20291]|uniref:DUF2946 family protein n=1 Tax=Bradyrhizobium sp. HKCCYLS20291 TaxID=3420766 RepID=UPI003EB973DE
MSWFRANIKQGSRLALIALLLQFALAFGHVHWIAGQAQGGGVTVAERHTAPSPADQDRDQQPSPDGCAICAVMAMAQSILLSPPPVLTPPQAVASRLPDALTAYVTEAVIAPAFQPRAPPVA